MRHFIWYVIICLVFCCSAPESNVTLYPRKKRVSFPLLYNAATFSTCIRYKNGMVYFLDEYSSNILVYSLDSKELVDLIEISLIPPNRIGRIRGFSVWAPDTLIVEPYETNDLVIIDSSGKQLDRVPLDSDPVGKRVVLNATSLRSMDGGDVFLRDKEVVVIQYPYTLVHLQGKVREKDLERFRMFYLYDLESDKGRFSGFGLPRNYFEKGKVLAAFSVICIHGRYVYACKLDSDLFWTDDFATFHAIPYTSRYIPEQIPTYNPADPDPYAFLAGTSEYTGFYYDPWRRVIYRFGRIKVSPELLQEANYDYEQVVRYPPDWFVQVFDEDLNMLCEARFTGHRYSPHNAFVAPEGLYVSISNPMREDYTEDSLRFELFELVEK